MLAAIELTAYPIGPSQNASPAGPILAPPSAANIATSGKPLPSTLESAIDLVIEQESAGAGRDGADLTEVAKSLGDSSTLLLELDGESGGAIIVMAALILVVMAAGGALAALLFWSEAKRS